ncbi:MAG: helix-turn-helix transcriptional regulator [Myxococcales bacterium]|nr:helix-turn-helix transcriptional regulator [Myxococcales bacterium]
MPPDLRTFDPARVARSHPPLLAHHLQRLWVHHGHTTATEQRLPSGLAQLLVLLDAPKAPQLLLEGPRSRPFTLTHQPGRVLGIVFAPGGLRPFLNQPLSEVADQHVALSEVATWGDRLADAVAELRDPARIASAAAAVLSAAVRPSDPGIASLVAATEHCTRVGHVADRAGLSAAQLRDLFAEHVGIAPKRYARVRRVQGALPWLRATDDLATIARRGGWLDHAHFTRDFRAITGVTPSAYRRRVGRWANHLSVQAPAP